MAFGGDIEMTEVKVDDGLVPFTDSDSEFYTSDEEEVGPVSQEKSLGFVSDEKVAELVSDKKSVTFVSSEDEKEQNTKIRPKLTFKQRLAPLVRHDDEKFQKIESYFFSLLQTPGVSIDDILQGTFDDHEITLITPQSGPPDLVDWQRRNAYHYFENLETRFKGATDTLAFKLACLYFGFPVEPLRMGTLPFLLPPDSEPLDAKTPAFNADPLGFLNKYNTEENFVYDESILSLRGGGASKGKQKKKPKKVKVHKAIQEVTPKGDEMDFEWISESASNKVKPASSSFSGQPPLRIYSWQGAMNMNTSLNYVDFVATVDKLTSNLKHVDRSICVEIWQISPHKLVQEASGTLHHSVTNPPDLDPIWGLVQRYFGQDGDPEHACFVRPAVDGEASASNRRGGYQPRTIEKGLVRIENATNKDVAYMRVPGDLLPEHKPHQFSMEYTLAMKVLFPTGAPHAWVLYQHGFIGATYQYLDPPGGLWEQVTDSQGEWSSYPSIYFTLDTLDRDVTPIIVPGAFTSRKLPELYRKDFDLTNSTEDGTGLGKVYKAVELSLKNVNLKKECSGFEVWCQTAEFKDVNQKPVHIPFSGNITSFKSLEGWQRLLSSGVVPDEGFALVVRPVYKTYRLRKFNDDKKVVDLQFNNYDLAQFRSFVRNRLYGHYDPDKWSHVIVLSAINQESFQAELTIQYDTTEEQWQWIRRSIIEPELTVSVDDLGNEWLIEQEVWGPRYVAGNNSGTVPRAQAKMATEPPKVKYEKSSSPIPDEDSDQDLFEEPWVNNEAERMRQLRDRTFTSVNSIFTNPLKPVMPLHGPPLESIIKTGPNMPGVSIAMLTPTEVLRLQHEVHSLRLQLLDRTRECPYADCNRYFRFGDAEGLDKHVREDHYVLRCFLCEKDKHLLPYFNADQIKKHFVSEHVDDILKAYGQGKAKGSVGGSDEDVSEDSESDSDISDVPSLPDSTSKSKESPKKKPDNSFIPFVASATSSDTSSSDEDGKGNIEDQIDAAVKKYEKAIKNDDIRKQLKELKATIAEKNKKDGKETAKVPETTAPVPAPVPETTPKKVLPSSPWDNYKPLPKLTDLQPSIVTPFAAEFRKQVEEEEKKKKKKEEKEKKKEEQKKKEEEEKEKETVKPPEEVKPMTGAERWDKVAADMVKKAQELVKRQIIVPGEAPDPVPPTPTSATTTGADMLDRVAAEMVKKVQELKAQTPIPTPAPVPTPGKEVLLSSQVWDDYKSLPKQTTKQPSIPAPVDLKSAGLPKDIPKPEHSDMVPVVDPKTEPNFNIFTAYNPNYSKSSVIEASQWIGDAIERHYAGGGKRHIDADATGEAKFGALRKINENPGTWQENLAFIRKQMEEYVALGGKLPSDSWPKATDKAEEDAAAEGSSSGKPKALAPAFESILAGLVAQTIIKNTARDGKKKQRKRKRVVTEKEDSPVFGDEIYEYSERSAVFDPPADLVDDDAPPSPKKQRSSKGKAPVVITRTGRAVKPSRAAREAAAETDSDTLSLSSVDVPKSPGDEEESSEFEFGMENIVREL
ncbi:hypothetical protein F4679DRAFT_377137 [Xylaria curta]|nr:hypothetical protein F4679DRAFT_377137 [Xylaria curta]